MSLPYEYRHLCLDVVKMAVQDIYKRSRSREPLDFEHPGPAEKAVRWVADPDSNADLWLDGAGLDRETLVDTLLSRGLVEPADLRRATGQDTATLLRRWRAFREARG